MNYVYVCVVFMSVCVSTVYMMCVICVVYVCGGYGV